MTRLEVVELPADRLPGDALLVPLFEDQRPLAGPVGVVDWRLDGVTPSTVPNVLLLGEQTPSYHVNVVRVGMRYKF